MTGPAEAYAGTVRAWAAHLVAGGTTPWADWVAQGHPPADGAGPVPCAPQLEVVRRLADPARPGAAARDPAHLAGLAEVVLSTPGPGRGMVDAPLVWPGDEHRIGTPAVDPGEVPVEELVRVCVGVLARLLRDLAPEPAPAGPRPRRLFRRSFALHGSPGTAASIRGPLLRAGLVEGGRKPVHLVLVGPLDQMMAEQWVVRVRNGGAMKWERLWQHASANDRIPPAIQGASLADRLARELGPDRVHVVLATDARECLAAAGAVLGVRPDGLEERDTITATDLLRRLNGVLSVTIGDARRRAFRGVLDDLLAPPPGTPVRSLHAPTGQLDWADSMATRIQERLLGAGYAVHGDPAVVVPDRAAQLRRSVDPSDTLDLALVACERAWSSVESRVGTDDRDDRGLRDTT